MMAAKVIQFPQNKLSVSGKWAMTFEAPKRIHGDIHEFLKPLGFDQLQAGFYILSPSTSSLVTIYKAIQSFQSFKERKSIRSLYIFKIDDGLNDMTSMITESSL